MHVNRLLSVVLAVGLLVSACGDSEPAAVPAPPPATVEIISIDDLIGLPLDEFTDRVSELGLGPVRVAGIDGEEQALSADFVEGRVNVDIETTSGTDIVVDAYVEGAAVSDDPASIADVATVVETTPGVEYYPACGNETLEFDGVTWYIIGFAEFGVVDELFEQQWSEISATQREPSPVFGPNGYARVAEPGPGDDVGTLVVWSDGAARWVSDSGDLDVWLVQNELEVLWVC